MKFQKALFSASTDTKHFTAEASDLEGWNVSGTITLVSDTGCEATFEMHTAQRDRDHDFEYWEYLPTTESLTQLPRLAGWKVIIFND